MFTTWAGSLMAMNCSGYGVGLLFVWLFLCYAILQWYGVHFNITNHWEWPVISWLFSISIPFLSVLLFNSFSSHYFILLFHTITVNWLLIHKTPHMVLIFWSHHHRYPIIVYKWGMCPLSPLALPTHVHMYTHSYTHPFSTPLIRALHFLYHCQDMHTRTHSHLESLRDCTMTPFFS